jgi:hypothetical protein
MKNYTLAALISAFAGWLAASVFLWIGIHFIEGGITGASMATAFVIYTSLFYSLFINLFFIQIPRTLIKRVFTEFNRAQFIFTVLIFGTFIFVLPISFLFGWLDGGFEPFDILLLANALVNSIVFGITFTLLYKPAKPEHL